MDCSLSKKDEEILKIAKEANEYNYTDPDCPTAKAFNDGFVNGYKAAQGDGWISVEDDLPEIGDLVNVFTPDCKSKVKSLMRLIRYEEAVNFYWDNWSGTDTHIQEAVTYWRPMPEPPIK